MASRQVSIGDAPQARPRVTRRVENVRIDTVRVDRAYQRPLDQVRVDRIAGDLDLDAIGIPYVARRADGSHWALDGQTRLAALVKVGLGDCEIPMEVKLGLTKAQEAAEYRKRNNTKALTTLNRFHAAVAEGDPEAKQIVATVKQYRLTVAATGANALSAVGALVEVWRKDEGVTAQRTLHVLTTTYGPVRQAVQADLIAGFGTFLFRWAEQIDLQALCDRVAKEPGGPLALLGNARSLAQIRRVRKADAVADILTNVWNKPQKRDKLPDWQVGSRLGH